MRRFKCRNGVVIEELEKGVRSDTQFNEDGFQDDYRVVEWNGVEREPIYEKWICMWLTSKGFPVGGAYGPDWDIIEEVV